MTTGTFSSPLLLAFALSVLYRTATSSPAPLAQRITDGEPHAEGAYGNVTVSIRIQDMQGNISICHGVLISDQHVLTSARCVDVDFNSMKVFTGVYDYMGDTTVNEHRSRKQFIHPFYRPAEDVEDISQRSRNDIAIVKLIDPIDFETIEAPVSIAPIDETVPAPGSTAFMVGWGAEEESDVYLGPLPSEAEVTVMTNAECERSWLQADSVSVEPRPGDGTVCVIDQEGSSVLCEFDEGGPLFVDGKVVAIASYAQKDCSNGAPSVYTLIAPYVCWIESMGVPGVSARLGPCQASATAPTIETGPDSDPAASPPVAGAEGGQEEGAGGSSGGDDESGDGVGEDDDGGVEGGNVEEGDDDDDGGDDVGDDNDGDDEEDSDAPPSSSPPVEGVVSDSPEDAGGVVSDAESNNACFPASALVTLKDGTTRRMENLKVGDQVLVAGGRFSEVFFFSHRKQTGLYSFIKLSTSLGVALTASSSHYVYANGALTAAGSVSVGESLTLHDGQSSVVQSVEHVMSNGLYSPHTLDGSVVVDSALASCYTTTIHPTLATTLLAPLRHLYNLGVSLPGLLDEDAPQFMLSLPFGSADRLS